jgi:hypothetical protein
MSEEFSGYEETQEVGWFARIKGALAGLIVGPLMVVIFLGLLVWNEGRAVKRARDLEAGLAAVVSVKADAVEPANEGRLVHFSGMTQGGPLADLLFRVSAEGVRLLREVEMYQWREEVKTEQEKQLGGSTVERKRYLYSKVWSSTLIDSSGFQSEQYSNPDRMPYESEAFAAQPVRLGAFELGADFVEQLDKAEPLALGSGVALPPELSGKSRVQGSEIYVGQDPGTPEVGDVRIRFSLVKPDTISVVGRQGGSRLEPYQTAEMSTSINLLGYGSLTSQQLFKAAEDENTIITWVLRAVGLLFVFVGVRTFFMPLSVLADVVPFIGGIVEVGATLASLLIALPLALTTIAVAWIAFRPLVAVGLLVVAGAALYGVFSLARSRRQARLGASMA